MLKGIPAVLSPDLLKTLMEMGHGDEIVLADGNFPAAAFARRLVRADGLGIPELLDAILRFLPLDYRVERPATLMAIPPDLGVEAPVRTEYVRIAATHGIAAAAFGEMEREAFYERSRGAYAIVATGERQRFANLVLRKGIVLE